MTGIKFPNDVKHKPLRPPVNRTPRLPSPEAPEEEEHEIGEEDQHQQHSPAALIGAGLTGSQDRSDRSPLRQHSHRRCSSSPIKKLINLFIGMCKSQRDIEVEQQRQWRASKKERDSVKMMHNAMNLQPPRSPISPTPLEPVIPSVEERMQGYADSGTLSNMVISSIRMLVALHMILRLHH